MGKSLKILILIHPELNPFKVGLSKSKHVDSPCKAESFLFSTLSKLGHQAEFLELDENIDPLVKRVNEAKVDLVFNFLEELSGEAKFDFHAISYLESKGIRFTGNGPRALMITRDKRLSKLLVAGSQIKTAKSFLIEKEGDLKRIPLSYPLFIKFNLEDASLGITQNNRVENERDLQKIYRNLRQVSKQTLLVEEFIAGSDVSVGLLGNKNPVVFPARELKFPDDNWVAGEQVKFQSQHRSLNKIRSKKLVWKSLEEKRRFETSAIKIYRQLGMRGYGRLDFRRTPGDDEFFFLEANSNPDLSKDEDFSESAKSLGISYGTLIEKILKLGLGSRR